MSSVLQPIVDGQIWYSERLHSFSGMRLRVRSTVVRLEDGTLFVHSPPPPDTALRRALDALGPVRWIVVPNLWHQVEAPSFAAAYPDAVVVGPPSALSRNPTLTLDMELRAPTFAAAVPELDVVHLDGVPFWDETVFFHVASRTLIATDLLARPSREDHWTVRIPARLTRIYDRVTVPWDARRATPPNVEAARSLEAMLSLPIARITTAHFGVIDERPQEHLADAWRYVLEAPRGA